VSGQLHDPKASDQGKTLGTHWIGASVDLRAGTNLTEKRNVAVPCLESNPNTPVVQPIDEQWTVYQSVAFHSEHSRKSSSEKEISLYGSLRLDQGIIDVSKFFRLSTPTQKPDYIILLVLYFLCANKILCIMKHAGRT
jgi:hypothetical protein